MTAYISFRSGGTGRSLAHPVFLAGNGEANPVALRPMSRAELAATVNGRDLLFGVHGFNVGFGDGVRQMAQLERRLALPPPASFFGILWPGDFFLPVVNYPFEAEDAVICGRRLAALCNGTFGGAASISFVAHSLGSRLVLEAAANLRRKARTMCLAAAAVDRDALSRHYSAAVRNCETISVLSSRRDMVLQVAYPVGDLVSDLLGDPDSPFGGALGYSGPHPPPGPTVRHRPIPNRFQCNHWHYLPQGRFWEPVAEFVRAGLTGSDAFWPPAS